jgi:DNA-binding transcriptional regulator PaaX
LEEKHELIQNGLFANLRVKDIQINEHSLRDTLGEMIKDGKITVEPGRGKSRKYSLVKGANIT